MLREREELRKKLETSKDELEDMIKSGSRVIIAEDSDELEPVQGQIKIAMSHLSGLINNTSSGVLLYDQAGRITDVNEIMLKMLSYKRNELISKHRLELLSSEIRSAVNVWNIDYITKHEKRNLPPGGWSSKYNENNLLDKNGNLVPVLQCSSLIMDKDNSLAFVIFLNKELMNS